MTHPRKMYFTDWGARSGIYSAWLDGSNVMQIESGNISWPNGLTIDRDNQVNISMVTWCLLSW